MNRGCRVFAPVLIGLALLLAPGTQPASAQSTNCPASSSWVTSPSQPDFNTDPSSLCQFYQYSWQSFLYLTSPAPGGGGALNFETMDSVTDVVAPTLALKEDNNIPTKPTLFLDKRQNRLRRFEARDAKVEEDDFSHTQAGGPKGVLVDQNNNVTFYEQFLDPVAANFINNCFLDVAACQTAPAAATLRFPAGAIELKVSWRPLNAYDPSANSYYTLQNVTVTNPQTGQQQTYPYFALIGFHLVYTTPGHPEMVWATFEHIDNAPDGPCTGPTKPPSGYSGWAFNKASQTDCSNVNSFPSGQQPPYPITQAFRNYAYGSDSSTSQGKTNMATIQSINQSVLGFLPASSVWKNYFLVGAIWTNGQLPATFGSNEFGSTLLANATMETFTQFPNPSTGSGTHNCFNCHNAETTSTNPPNPPAFKVSHALAGNSGTCPYTTTLPPGCSATQPATTGAAAPKKTAVDASPVEPVASHGQR